MSTLAGAHWCPSLGPVPLGVHAPCNAGVAQMANKANGLPFTIADQESLEVRLCTVLVVCAVTVLAVYIRYSAQHVYFVYM